MSSFCCRAVLTLCVCWVVSPLCAQREFGFDNSKPSGQPYLTPEESVKRFQVPPGWEVKVFAAEPDIINPIAFTIDERGRVWVVECFEYPKRTPQGKRPRDRIKILEDTDGDGRADKVTVWAEGKDFPAGDHNNGFDMASGIEVGCGGVFLGAPPYLFFLKDTKGTGKCDSREVLLKGFGSTARRVAQRHRSAITAKKFRCHNMSRTDAKARLLRSQCRRRRITPRFAFAQRSSSRLASFRLFIRSR